MIPDPRWGKLTPATADLGIVFNYLPEGTCDLELRPDRPGGATYFETKGSTTGIIWFKPEEMRSIEERGVATELHVKTGTGPWEEIATINPDEVVEVGGDRFYLEKEVAAQTRGLTLVTCEYDLDPQWEIEIIAEDGAGNRTQPRSGLSFNAFTRREKREWTQNILMDKSDIDHFVILERALESHIIRDIPMVGAGLENDPADGDLEPDSGSRADSSIANEVEFEIVAGETLH